MFISKKSSTFVAYMSKQNKNKKQQPKASHAPRSRAFMQYVIAIVWMMVAVGNFFYGNDTMAIVFSALGLLQVIVAVVVDVIETRKVRRNGKK